MPDKLVMTGDIITRFM